MKRRFPKIGKWLLIVLLVLAIAHGIASVILGRRYAAAVEKIRAQGDHVSIKEIVGPPIPAEENAAPIYQKAFHRMKGPYSANNVSVLDYVADKDGVGQIWDPGYKIDLSDKSMEKLFNSPTFWADADKAAAHFAGLVPTIEAAVAKPEARFPVHWEDGLNAKVPHYWYLRKISQYLAAQAILQARAGQHEQALRTLGLAFKEARNSSDEGVLIGLLVRCGMINFDNNGLLSVLKHHPLTADEARTWNAVLEETDYTDQYAKSLKNERAVGIWSFNYLMQGGFGDILAAVGSQGYKPTRLQSRALVLFGRPVLYFDATVYLEHVTKEIAAADQPYRAGALRRLDREFHALPNYLIMTKILMPNFSELRARVDETRTRTALTQVVIAAQSYKARTGSYPVSMQDLKARTPWKLPQDPFSGRDFLYKPSGKGFIVYSVGRNLRDDGGVPSSSPSFLPSGKPAPEHPGDFVLYWH